MIIPITFTQEDLEAGKLLEPGKYICDILDISQQPSAKGDSMNFKIKLKNPDHKVTMIYNMNEKGMWAPSNQNYFRALGVDLKPGVQIDLDATKGRKLGVFVKRGQNKSGTPINQVDDFFPAE